MGTVDIKDTTKEELSRMMVGRDVQLQVDKKPADPGRVVLDVENVTMHSAQHKKDAVGMSLFRCTPVRSSVLPVSRATVRPSSSTA